MVQEEMQFKGISYLELWHPFCSAERNHLCNFCKGYPEEQFCELILNLGQWFRRCRLKDFLPGVLATLLFSGAEPFMQFWKRASWGTFMWSYMKLRPVVQEEMSFKEKVYGRTDKDRSQYHTLSLRPGELKIISGDQFIHRNWTILSRSFKKRNLWECIFTFHFTCLKLLIIYP